MKDFKEIKYRNKKLKIIPKAKLVDGKMDFKGISKDLKRGYKPIYKKIIDDAMYYLYPNWEYFDAIHANAYCDEKDTFSEKVGIEVCSAKLDMKNHLKLAKAYDRLHRILIETAVIVGSLCMEHTEKAKAIEDDLCTFHGRMKV